jgi:hypothetical protein
MRDPSRLATDRPLFTFFLLAYALAWLAWSPLVLSRSGIGLLPFDLPLWTTLPGSYAPLVAACIVQRLSAGDYRFGKLAPIPSRALASAVLGSLLIGLGFVLLPSLWLSGGTAQTALCNQMHSIEQRLSRWLLTFADRLHSEELPATQELIAEMLGVTFRNFADSRSVE